ncbi:RING finger protein 11-like [Dendropsophus ebraccatus]|uniref:RING finger protein 11-like n=1 Tax=Dendropsophus ebraccatus TaxID=150705 RepID=UPI0038321405
MGDRNIGDTRRRPSSTETTDRSSPETSGRSRSPLQRRPHRDLLWRSQIPPWRTWRIRSPLHRWPREASHRSQVPPRRRLRSPSPPRRRQPSDLPPSQRLVTTSRGSETTGANGRSPTPAPNIEQPPLEVQPPAEVEGNVPVQEGPSRASTRDQLIEGLPTRPIEDSEDLTCTICILDLEAGEQVTVLPCCHVLHQSCITPWLQRNPECPICRANCFP